MALARQERLDDALPHFERAAALAPGDPEAHANLARASIARRRFDQAILECERALHLSPNMAEAHYYLGIALVATKRNTEGLAHWREVLRTTPDNPKVLSDAAWVLADLARHAIRNGKEALEMAEHAVQLTSGSDPMALARLAAAYAETGQFDKAIDFDQRAIQLAVKQGNSLTAEAFRARLKQFEAKYQSANSPCRVGHWPAPSNPQIQNLIKRPLPVTLQIQRDILKPQLTKHLL